MKNEEADSNLADKNHSLEVIREMIQVSQKKLKNDGILFILWGWLMFFNYTYSYFSREFVLPYHIGRLINFSGIILGILAIAFSLWYVFRQRKRVQTYIGISLRYVWISLFVCLSLTSMIISNVIHASNFELQHPIFMMFIAFATVITGGILRYRLLIFGGIVFGILAYACSYFPLREQMLFEAAAWMVAFIIPGHLLYSTRNK